MAGQFGHLGERRILPDQDLILWIAVRGDQLRGVLRPCQIAHLWAGVHALHGLARQRVPKPDTSVRRSPAAGQQTVMMRWPGDRLHRRHMFRIRLHRTERVLIPYIESVIVAATGQILIIRRPFQATHLLPVPGQPSFRLQLRCSRIPLDDPSVPRSARQDIAVPGQSPHARRVAVQLVDLLVGGHVPHRHVAVVGAHGDCVAPFVPRHRRHCIGIRTEITQAGNLRQRRISMCRDVDGKLKFQHSPGWCKHSRGKHNCPGQRPGHFERTSPPGSSRSRPAALGHPEPWTVSWRSCGWPSSAIGATFGFWRWRATGSRDTRHCSPARSGRIMAISKSYLYL